MEYKDNLDIRVSVRLFGKETRDLELIAKYAEDEAGYRRYRNVSHALRCAVMRFINQEKEKLLRTKGRPKEYCEDMDYEE